MRVLLAGMVVRHPHQGGAVWAVLQWVLGLRLLGHDVTLLEQLPGPPTAHQRAYAELVHRQTGVRPVLLWPGSGYALAGVDLLVNLSGGLRDPALLAGAARRLYVDLDPGFTQVWHDQGVDVGLGGHDAYATVGLAVGRPGCLVPTLGLPWLNLLPPVALEHWSPLSTAPRWGVTTVGHWRSYGPLTDGGVVYGQRAHSLRRLWGLPGRSPLPLQLALGISPGETADLTELDRHGWHLLDPQQVAADPQAYRAFVRGSTAELGIAKSGYVDARSGWFSDRSACYLAAGRPVVAQDTGWSAALPTGAGLFAFDDLDGAVAGLQQVAADPAGHGAAARDLAREHLDARTVLGRLLEQVA